MWPHYDTIILTLKKISHKKESRMLFPHVHLRAHCYMRLGDQTVQIWNSLGVRMEPEEDTKCIFYINSGIQRCSFKESKDPGVIKFPRALKMDELSMGERLQVEKKEEKKKRNWKQPAKD